MKRALLLLLLCGCPKATPQPPPPVDAGQAGLPRAHIDVEAADGKAYGLEVELALDGPSRTKGLMFRKSLADTEGMLFVFPEPEPHAFWMKNTLIPLDMLFADGSGRVLGVVPMAEPLTTSPRAVEGESKYVLEVPGGWCAARGVGAGARLQLGQAANARTE